MSTRPGNLVVTRQSGQVNVYENNELLFYTNNIIVNEESVHFAMIQHPDPRQVLLLSGVVAGMPAEILKYPVDRITCLETDTEILTIPGRFTDSLPGGSKLAIVKRDIRNFIAATNDKYDVILINLPPPSSLGVNRFNTAEFFGLIKKHCKAGTVISTSLPSTVNYADENALDANASLWKTLGLFFNNRMLLTGEKNYFLASDAGLSPDITEMISARSIPTQYVNSFYVDDKLLQMRSVELTSRFSDKVPVNRDFKPFIYTREISYWLSYFETPYHLLVIVPVLLFLLLFIRTDRITSGLYTGGFTAASLELVLLLAYQIFFGSIYLSSALFFAVFMAGLATGSSGKIKFRLPQGTIYYLVQFFLALFAVVLPLLIKLAGVMDSMPLARQILFFTMLLVLSVSVGLEFQLASHLSRESYSMITGNNYGTDLAGSALGAFMTAIVLLPLLGLVYTCILVAGLNIFSGFLAFSAKKAAYAW
jgi:spermidine synthase